MRQKQFENRHKLVNTLWFAVQASTEFFLVDLPCAFEVMLSVTFHLVRGAGCKQITCAGQGTQVHLSADREKTLEKLLVHNGQEVLVCRQVDDFVCGAADRKIAEAFINEVRKYVKAEYEGMGIKVDINQMRDYHGWMSNLH